MTDKFNAKSNNMSTHIPNPFNAAEDAGDVRVAIVRAEWNGHITGALAKSCVDTLASHGVDCESVDTFDVPGAVELTYAASSLIETGLYDVVVVFGCVIRGGTPHFDYVCQSVTQGITHLNAECDIPVIFGVLTVDNEQDALDRIGGPMGDKGAEAAEAALKMHAFAQRVKEL